MLEIIQALPRPRRNKLLGYFKQLRESPTGYSDYRDHDAVGRKVEVTVFDGWAIYYWIDHADRQVKILQMATAD